MAFTGERGPVQGPKMQQIDKGSGVPSSGASREHRKSDWSPVLSGQTSETRRAIGALAREGFKPNEVMGLLHTAENSDGARRSQATLKRLQFTKWLVDQGLLDEFSLRTE